MSAWEPSIRLLLSIFDVNQPSVILLWLVLAIIVTLYYIQVGNKIKCWKKLKLLIPARGGKKDGTTIIKIHMKGCSIRCHLFALCWRIWNTVRNSAFNSRLVLLGQHFGNYTKKGLSSLLSVFVSSLCIKGAWISQDNDSDLKCKQTRKLYIQALSPSLTFDR